MATIYTPHTVFATVAAAQKIAAANAEEGDGWEYRVVPDPAAQAKPSSRSMTRPARRSGCSEPLILPEIGKAPGVVGVWQDHAILPIG